MNVDSVLTHPHHPSLCGVAKFSHALAAVLKVPCYGDLGRQTDCPLLSVKGAEGDLAIRDHAVYDLFAHDATGCVLTLLPGARRVFAANPVIGRALRRLRPDVVDAWCPSTVRGNTSRGGYRVLTFGMAHKLDLERYRALKARLDADGKNYTVSVSTAVHEGSPWDATATVADALRGVFGPRLRVLGYLADDALAVEMKQADLIVLYFSPAVRANNTTYWAALASGTPVETNCDEDSPTVTATWADLEALLGA